MPISRRPHIFARIAKNEDDFTELLVNFLSSPTQTDFIDAFGHLIVKDLPSAWQEFDFRKSNIKTQSSQEERQRPDIEIHSSNSDYCLFIECKIGNATLTANQPNGYLDELSKKNYRNVALAFLVPTPYQYEEEIANNARSWNKKNKHIPLKIIHWLDVIKVLRELDGSTQDPLRAELIRCLENKFDSSVQFNHKEVAMMYDKAAGAQVKKLIDLVMNVAREVSEIGYIAKLESNEYGFGYYIKDQTGKQVLWFGLGYSYWETKGFPLVYGVSNKQGGSMSKEDIAQFQSQCGGEWYEDWEWYLKPLPERYLTEIDNAKAIAEHLDGIIREITPKALISS